MASFTDSPELLTRFNPYVQQLPVDAMMAVGVEKQRRYDEGIQKIQSAIDRVAGLDIMKDQHKAYLKSKLSQLDTRLKTVAAGDFSNYQLTNQVAGITSSIGKDPVVVNAVASTQRIRKGQSDIETARKEGKSSVVNEDYWSYEVNKWLEDDDLSKSFNGSYIPYRDIDKKLREITKEIPEISKSVDIPYRRDAQGNVIYYQKDKSGKVISASTDPSEGGSPEIDDAMLTIKTKGKSAQKLLDNFYSSLDADDLRQLKMNSWHHYRGATADKFKNDAIKIYNDSKEMLSNQIVELNMELTTQKDLTSAEKSVIQAKIKAINEKLSNGSLEKVRDEQIREITEATDLDDYKYRLYTQSYLTDKAKALAYESYEQEIKNNPYFQAYMDRANLQLGYDRIRNENENKRLDRQWEMTKFYAGLAAKQKESNIPVTPGRIPTDVDPPSLIKLDQEIKEKDNQIKQLTGEYAKIITGEGLNTPELRAANLDKLFAEYATNPSFIRTVKDPNLKRYLERRRALEIAMGQKQNLYISASNASSKFDEAIDKALSKEQGIRLSDGTNYSARELNELLIAKDRYYTKQRQTMTVTGDTPVYSNITELDAYDFQKDYEGTKYEALVKAISKQYTGQPLTPAERIMVDRANQIHSKFKPIIGSIEENKLRFQTDYLAQHMPERQTMVGTLDSKNEDHMRIVQQLVGDKKREYESGGIDSEFKKKFNPDIIDNKLRQDPQTTYTIIKKYNEYTGPTADLVISLGNITQVIPMNTEEFARYFPNEARVSPTENIKYAVMASPNKTTNMMGGKNESAAVNAYLSGYNLPLLSGTDIAGLVRLDIEGEAFNDGSDDDMFAIRMYVNDNGTWKTDLITGNDFISEQKIQEFLNNIGPATVSDFLRRNQ
jgi:transcriptional regulator of met regulon